MVRLIDLLRAHGQAPADCQPDRRIVNRPAADCKPDPPCVHTGKKRYADEAEAVAAIARLREEDLHHTDKGSRLHPFRCGGCGGWHIGHRARGGRRHRRA
jgi:hypothetical protein